jgi:hypothetical protein
MQPRTKSSTAALVVAAIALVTAAAPAFGEGGSPNPPNPPRGATGGGGQRVVVPAGAIKAVVVKSWGGCSSGSLIWDQLNANWSAYGSIPIVIDYSNTDLCGSSFTLAALEASGADVVILNDPAGRPYQYTTNEVAALQQYASEGHDLIGTYLTFAYPNGGIDNSALAPLFGLSATAGWTGGDSPITPTYKIKRRKARALARHLPNPYVSSGFDFSQRPGDGIWSSNELQGARIVAITADKMGAITIYRSGEYNAVFIANMPEYGGGTDDQQFFYNAIIYPKRG